MRCFINLDCDLEYKRFLYWLKVHGIIQYLTKKEVRRKNQNKKKYLQNKL